MSVFTERKAVRLFREGRILVRCENGELVAIVRGDTGVHTVVLDRQGRACCDCQSWRRLCSHALALELLTEGKRVWSVAG